MRSFDFAWHCMCGASWRANFTKSPGNGSIARILESLRKEWERVHRGEGHAETADGRAAAWARRKAETEKVK